MDDKPTLGLVGLGNLGRAIALRLLGAGYRLLVNDRRWEVAQALELHGATAIPTPLLLAEEVDMFLTCLPGDEELFEVYIGPEGALEHLRPGATVIDFSTASPMMMQRIDREARLRQIDVVDAPVGGGPVEANSGQLTMMVGAEPAVFERMMPLLGVLGREIYLVGPPGMGESGQADQPAARGGELGCHRGSFGIGCECWGRSRDRLRGAALEYRWLEALAGRGAGTLAGKW
jgi:3-hydroxyisobutyrate dehydrogenase-like beta-hydroxyacid dehydrogenase